MRQLFVSVALAACCASAFAQAPNPFARPSAQPAAGKTAPGQGGPGYPPPPPLTMGQGGLPEMPNQPYPIGVAPPEMPTEQVESVPVKRIGKVNGLVILKGEQTYMFEKEKSLGLVRKPQLGNSSRSNTPGEVNPGFPGGMASQPTGLPTAGNGPIPATTR